MNAVNKRVRFASDALSAFADVQNSINSLFATNALPVTERNQLTASSRFMMSVLVQSVKAADAAKRAYYAQFDVAILQGRIGVDTANSRVMVIHTPNGAIDEPYLTESCVESVARRLNCDWRDMVSFEPYEIAVVDERRNVIGHLKKNGD